jgi:hypothetical protein
VTVYSSNGTASTPVGMYPSGSYPAGAYQMSPQMLQTAPPGAIPVPGYAYPGMPVSATPSCPTASPVAVYAAGGYPSSGPMPQQSMPQQTVVHHIHTINTVGSRGVPAGATGMFEPVEVLGAWYGVENGTPEQARKTRETEAVVLRTLKEQVARNGGFLALNGNHHVLFGIDPLPNVPKVFSPRSLKLIVDRWLVFTCARCPAVRITCASRTASSSSIPRMCLRSLRNTLWRTALACKQRSHLRPGLWVAPLASTLLPFWEHGIELQCCTGSLKTMSQVRRRERHPGSAGPHAANYRCCHGETARQRGSQRRLLGHSHWYSALPICVR